jgi:hypothetical protein
MIDKGLPCVTCGEPVWATFEEVARRSMAAMTIIAASIKAVR